MGLPVLQRSSSCVHALATTPAESTGACIARFPIDDSLPSFSGGSTSASNLSRPAQRSLTLGLYARQVTSSDPLHRRLQPASLPPRLLRLLPAGATVAGWDLHPLEDRAFARRTLLVILQARHGFVLLEISQAQQKIRRNLPTSEPGWQAFGPSSIGRSNRCAASTSEWMPTLLRTEAAHL